MTRSAHTTPPPDAAARRSAPAVLTYSVEQLPPFDADWSEEDVWTYIRARQVPYNALHDHGYRSIGCAPCTRAVEPGEDVRAGRWWWENPEHKECGLHVRPVRLITRSSDASAEIASP